MNDIEIELINLRCRGDELLHLVQDVTRNSHGFAELVELVMDEIDASRNRWTPYYDRALQLVVDNHDVFRRFAFDRASIIGFSREDFLPINVEWELDQHGRACDFLDAALASGARFLSEAWPRVTSETEAILVLGLLPNPTAMIEPIRRLAIADLKRNGFESSHEYLDAALAASRGLGSWDAVEQIYARWADEHAELWNTYDGSLEEHLNAMCRVPRKDATLEDVCYGMRSFSVERIKRDLGNPFMPIS